MKKLRDLRQLGERNRIITKRVFEALEEEALHAQLANLSDKNLNWYN